MYIYKKDDPVPMKFHYVIIFLLFIRCFLYIGQIPEVLDAEEMIRGTAFDWYGKLSVSVVVVMLAMSGIGGFLLLKRKDAGIALCILYIGIEIAYRIVSDVVGKKIDPSYQGNALIFTVIYLVLIVIISVYYEKRKMLFEKDSEGVKINMEKKSGSKIEWSKVISIAAILGYVLYAAAHFYAAFSLYGVIKLWAFLAILLAPVVGDLFAIGVLIASKIYGPVIVYAVAFALVAVVQWSGERK